MVKSRKATRKAIVNACNEIAAREYVRIHHCSRAKAEEKLGIRTGWTGYEGYTRKEIKKIILGN